MDASRIGVLERQLRKYEESHREFATIQVELRALARTASTNQMMATNAEIMDSIARSIAILRARIGMAKLARNR